MTAEQVVHWVKKFHDAYEQVAPGFEPWAEISAANRDLLRAACIKVVGPLLDEIKRLQGQPAFWEETAAQEARNREYYRGLVVRIGNLFGHEAHVQDDGGVVEDVLCAKVPELVERLQRENEALRRWPC